jgi:signal recognition particle receptor subunit beta
MPSIDVKKRRIDSKVVYYGPGRCGKTSNLKFLHGHLGPEHCGRLSSLPTKNDATLLLDVLPVRFGKIIGFDTVFHLCAGPGQALAVNTRKLLLRDTDGIVFVADSDPRRAEANIDSLNELEENLGDYGLRLSHVPHVMQYNKRDLQGRLDQTEMRAKLNRYGVPEFRASALRGDGVLETVRAIVKSVGADLRQRI